MKIKKTNRKKEKVKKRLVPLTILGMIILGVVYQQFSIYYNASHLGRMGRLIEVNGVNMHLYDSGTGDLPIVFTADIGSNVPYVDLYPLHSALAENNRVIIYDKPGYGWSDYTSTSRDIDSIVQEIHTVLHSNDVPDDEDTYLKPFIYVAQGMGALEAIRYTQLYPEDVAGIVFIEGTSPSFLVNYNNIMIIESFLINALRNTGLLRLMSGTNSITNILNDNPELSPELRALNKGMGLEKNWNRNIIAEKLSVSSNAEVVLTDLEEQKLGDLPIRVVTSEANVYTTWNQTQRALLNLSTDSKQFIIKGSTSQIEKKDLPTMLTAIEELIAHIHELRDDY